MGRNEAKCKSCGARYALQSKKMPKAMKCFCDNKTFEVLQRK